MTTILPALRHPLLALVSSHVDFWEQQKNHCKGKKMVNFFKQIFIFREWKEGPSLEYYNATLEGTGARYTPSGLLNLSAER